MSGLTYRARHPSTAYTNVASVIAQLTTSADTPITINRVKLQANVISSGQAIVVVQFGVYATGHAAGTTGTPLATQRRNTLAADTTFRYASATLGTTFTAIDEFQWNTAMPWEDVMGMEEIKIEIPAASVFAIIFPSGPGTPTVSGSIDFMER